MSSVLYVSASAVFAYAFYYAYVSVRLERTLDVAPSAFYGAKIAPDLSLLTLASLLLCLLGLLAASKPFKPVSWADELQSRSIDTEDAQPGFATLRHRGQVFFAK